jgi:tetratricopeptide (TPR) repeat protein
MNTNDQNVSHPQKDDPSRLKNAAPEEREDNPKVCTTTIDAENSEVSKTQSEKDLVEKDDPWEKKEIDLSHPSSKTDLARDKGKIKPEEAICIQSPTEAILETETKPVEESRPKEGPKTILPEKKKSRSQKTKPEKLSKAGFTDETKIKGEKAPKKTKAHVSKPIPEQVIKSEGVAYLEGNTIRLAGGTKLHPGDQIKIKDKEFILKARERKRKFPYIFVFIFLVAAVIILPQLLKGKSSGRLVGIVLEEKSKTALSNAEIQVMELGKKVRSNQLGFFMFDFVPSGSYTLQVSLKGYQVAKDNVTITKKQTTTLSVSLSPKTLAGLPERSSTEIASGEESTTKTVALEGTEAQDRYGAISIESNVSEPLAMIDDQMLGTGNKVYKNVSLGKHTLRITKQGYQDWTQKIDVKRGKTLNLRVSLQETTQANTSPQTAEEWIALAQSQRDSQDFASAVNSYSQALSLDPKSPEALLGRGLVCNQLNDRAKACEDLNKAAEYFINEKNYDQAIICYTHLLELNDQDAGSFYNRGLCYFKLDQYEKSISDLEKAVNLDKKFFLGYLQLGEAYYKSGNYEASLENYKKAKKLNPENLQVYVGLVKTYFAKGERASAKKSYKKFEELSAYIDRERMKQDPEWRKVLEGIEE